MNRLFCTIALLVPILCLLNAQLANGQEFYDITEELQTVDPSAEGVEPIGINDHGWVVGHYPAGGGNRLFVWIPPTATMGSPGVTLLNKENGLRAAGISNNGTVIYNIQEESGRTTGYYRRYDGANYESAIGAQYFIMKAISEGWIAIDIQVGFQNEDNGIALAPPSAICPLNFNIDPLTGFPISFVPTNYVRAAAINIDGGGPGSTIEIGFTNAILCNLSSRAYAIKASPSGELLYVAGESFGLGRGDDAIINPRAMVYSRELNDTFIVTEQLGGTPGVIRGVNYLGGIAGSWYTPNTGPDPGGSLRGFYSGVGCIDFSGENLPFSDIFPNRSVLAHAINDDNYVVGNFLHTEEGEVTNRAFLYNTLTCSDRSSLPLNEDGELDFDILDQTFKDMTAFARSVVGASISDWSRLNTARAISSHNQIVGRGTLSSGVEHAYFFSFEPCDTQPLRGLYPKGDFGVTERANVEINRQMNDRLRRIYHPTFTESQRFADVNKSHLPLPSLFRNNDELEGPGNSQGWYVNEVPDYGPEPREEVHLLTNKSQFYPNSTSYEIISNPFLVPGATLFEWKEAFLGFKVWSHQERGVYDFVKIEIKRETETDWTPLAYISESFEIEGDFASGYDPVSDTEEEGWSNFYIDLSAWQNNNVGQKVRLRFTFESDICEFGDGIMFKDFALFGISEEAQVAEFLEFLWLAENEALIAFVEPAGGIAALYASLGTGTTVGTTGGVAVSAAGGVGAASFIPPVAFGIAAGLVISYAYLAANEPLNAYTILFSAPPDVLEANPSLETYLNHKKQVFFDGFWMSGALSSNVTTSDPRIEREYSTDRALLYGSIVNGFENIKGNATNATVSNPAYLQTFSTIQGKEMTFVFTTESSTVLNQNVTRHWLKRVFSEMALFTESITVNVYVHNTYTNEYIEITTPTEIGANTDYYYALGMAQAALTEATKIWESKRNDFTRDPNDQTIPAPDLVIPTRGDIVLRDDCQIDPTTTVRNRGNSSPKTQTQPQLSPSFYVPVTTTTEVKPCGGFVVWTGGAGVITRQTLERHPPNTACYSLMSNGINKPATSAIARPLNTITTWVIPYAGAIPWEVGTRSTPANDLFISPVAGNYYEGDEIPIQIKEGFTIDRAWYEKTFFESRKVEMERMGLKAQRKQVPIIDKTKLRIDHIDFEGDDLKPVINGFNIDPFRQIPANGNFTIRVCAKDASQRYVDEEIQIDVIPNRLSKIDEEEGRQRVIFDLSELDTEKHAAIFWPGASALFGRIHEVDIPGDAPQTKERRYLMQEDLVYRKTNPLPNERYTFFDKWDRFGTYVWHSPSYMEGTSFGINHFDPIVQRILDDPGARGVDFLDDKALRVLNNQSPEIPNAIAPSTPLWQADKAYLRNVLEQFSSAAAEAEAEDETTTLTCPLPGSEDYKRVVAIYTENVGILRLIPTITELLEENPSFANLRIRIGLMDPLWPDTHSTIGDVNQWLVDYMDNLTQKPNVTVFSAVHRGNSLRNRIYGSDGDDLLDLTIRYDLTAMDASLDGEKINPNVLLKYFHALGARGDVELTHCRGELFDPPTDKLGNLGIQACYRTLNENMTSIPFIGYKGPLCSLRGYFKNPDDFPTNSYGFKMLSFDAFGSNAEKQIRLLHDGDTNALLRFPMQIEDIRDADERAMEIVVTGEIPAEDQDN